MFSPLVRAKAPSSLEVTSISSNSGLALGHEKDTLSWLERDEGISCNDILGIKDMPSNISTIKIVFTENADNFMPWFLASS